MSNARSPREVCSTTIGTSGLMVLASFACTPGFLPNVAIAPGVPPGVPAAPKPTRGSAAGGPQLARSLRGLFLARRPQLLARLGLLDADRRRLGYEQFDG